MESWTRVVAGAALFAPLLATSGCLMPAPPELSDPEQTRPYIHYLKVDPPLGEPIQVQTITMGMDPTPIPPFPIVLPFQSEDLGEDVQAYLHLIMPNGTPDLQETTGSTAGEFSTVRNMRMDWNANGLPRGCYKLTATMAHASSFGSSGRVKAENLDDAEAVSWLANVFTDVEGPVTLDQCPRVGDVN